MHQARFYHMDVKPHNLVVRQDGRVFLIDFGCTFQSHEPIIDLALTSGDKTFFSPERCPAEGFCDASKMDAFGAGETLLFLGESQFSAWFKCSR